MPGMPIDEKPEEHPNNAAEAVENAVENQAEVGDTEGTMPPTGTRVTRRTVHRSRTREDVDEVVTEDVALWAPEPSAYPKAVG